MKKNANRITTTRLRTLDAGELEKVTGAVTLSVKAGYNRYGIGAACMVDLEPRFSRRALARG